MSRSWALTDAGLVCAAGETPGEIFARLLDPSRIEPRGEPAPIRDFDLRRYVNRRGLKQLSRSSKLACAAASKISESMRDLPEEEVGVVFGSAWGCLETIVRFERAAYVDGPRFVDPILFTETVANVPAGQISIVFGWSALNATVSAGTASGLEAIRLAAEALEDGRASVIVAGGGDELNPQVLRCLNPRVGVGSEGACLVALESAEHARSRRAPILGHVRAAVGGFVGTGDDAPTRKGCHLLRQLLERADSSPSEVGLLVVAGAVELTDTSPETSMLREIFGTTMPPTILPSASLGQCWAAAGPLAVVIALEAMRSSRLPPPTVTADGKQPTADVRRIERAVVLEQSSSGHVSALLLSADDWADD